MQNKYDRDREDEYRRWRDEREPWQGYRDDEEQRYAARAGARRFPEASHRPEPSRPQYSRDWRTERDLQGMGRGGREPWSGRDPWSERDTAGRRDDSSEHDIAEYRYWSGRDDSGYHYPSYGRYPQEEERYADRAWGERGAPGGGQPGRVWARDPSSGALYTYEYPNQRDLRRLEEARRERWPSDPGDPLRESDRRRAFSPTGAAERYRRLTGHAGKGPKGYVRSDERIREDVCDRLSDDDEVDASEISVSVKEGEVVIEGTVTDRYSKHRAEDIAESVSGVKDVSNHLRTRKSFVQELGDKLTGEDEAEHHGHSGSGTRNSPSGPAPRSAQSH